MIFLDRDRRHRNGRRIHPGDRWQARAEKETAKAKREGENHKVKDSIYAADRVRAALEALADQKCAYCEVSLTRFSWNVEHYRPKGRVRERPDHPGYYWLAYDWNNLLPSCTFCNQHRKERPTFDDPSPATAGGKADQFPLADERRRAMDHRQDIARESPLLLDPCADDPADHLAYDPNGGILAIAGSDKGATSINVFRLDLRRLVADRRRTLRIVSHALQAKSNAELRGDAEVARELMEIVNSLAADDMPFAGMVRYFVANPEALGLD